MGEADHCPSFMHYHKGVLNNGGANLIALTNPIFLFFYFFNSFNKKNGIVVPHLIDLRDEILREFHCSRFAVHPGGTKMYQDLRRQYYWSGMKRHVRDFVRRCLTCQQVKAEHQKPAGLLQPLEMAEWKWEHVTMDFVTHLPRTLQGQDAVWVIVDRVTKLAHFLAVRMTFTLERFCQLYI